MGYDWCPIHQVTTPTEDDLTFKLLPHPTHWQSTFNCCSMDVQSGFSGFWWDYYICSVVVALGKCNEALIWPLERPEFGSKCWCHSFSFLEAVNFSLSLNVVWITFNAMWPSIGKYNFRLKTGLIKTAMIPNQLVSIEQKYIYSGSTHFHILYPFTVGWNFNCKPVSRSVLTDRYAIRWWWVDQVGTKLERTIICKHQATCQTVIGILSHNSLLG